MSKKLALRTLGAVYVAGEDGVPLVGAAAQRQLLALLALLAAAGPAGMSRDRILGVLWSDADPDRGRRTLAQSLYHARKVLECEDLFVGTADLRLNREFIAADVWDFEAALASGDLEAAAAAYQGPFLDGFFLSGRAEFEQWAMGQRARLERRAADVFDRLASAAESRRDARSAVKWRRRLVTLNPFDARATVQLMTALAESGERGSALQHARVYETLLREQLDAEPDPAVNALVERLRTAPPTPPAVSALATEAVAAAAPVPAMESEESVESVPSDASTSAGVTQVATSSPTSMSHAPSLPPARRSRRAYYIMAAALAFVVTVVGLKLFTRKSEPPAPVPYQPIVVAPFRVTAADPSLRYLREGIVELLSARLADESVMRSVDPGVVLDAWRDAGFAHSMDVPRAEVVRIAKRFGASQAVTGSIVGNAARIVITASVLSVATGEATANVVVEGAADSVTALVERVAVGLLAAEASDTEGAAHQLTSSLPALRAFLEGQAAYRQGDYSAAVQQYERAITADSSFSLAAFQLALAADRVNDAEQHDRALALAWASRDQLSERDQAHLLAFAGPRYPLPSPENEQIAAWERAVSLASDRADVWYELGERYFRDGSVVGLPASLNQAAAALRRALELNPRHASARRLLILIAAHNRDTVTLAQLATPAALRGGMGDLGPYVRWRVMLALNRTAELRAFRARLPLLDRANLRAIAMTSQFDAVGLDDGERAIRALRANHTSRAADRLDALLAEHSFALNSGRPALALSLTDQIRDAQPGTHAELRLRVLDALYAEGDRTAAERAAQELATTVDRNATGMAATDAVRLADACVLGQWRLLTGGTPRVTRIVRELRAAGAPRVTIPVAATASTCAAILETMEVALANRPDAMRRVHALDSLMLSGPAAGDAGTYAYLIVSRLYERLGDAERARDAVRRRPYMTGWPRYLTTARREEGRLSVQLGDSAGAAEAYGQYLMLRARPEKSVQAQVDSVRAEVVGLATLRRRTISRPRAEHDRESAAPSEGGSAPASSEGGEETREAPAEAPASR